MRLKNLTQLCLIGVYPRITQNRVKIQMRLICNITYYNLGKTAFLYVACNAFLHGIPKPSEWESIILTVKYIKRSKSVKIANLFMKR